MSAVITVCALCQLQAKVELALARESTQRPYPNIPCWLQVWLQEFAWTEKDVERKRKARAAKLPDNPKLATEPMFCFELAIKLFYWSCLVYQYEEVSSYLDCNLGCFTSFVFSLEKPLKRFSDRKISVCEMHIRLLTHRIGSCLSLESLG